MKKNLHLLPLILLFFAACRKDVRGPRTPDLRVEEISTGNGQPEIIISSNTTVPPTFDTYNFVFDWENTDLMPTVSWVAPVYAPWSDNAIRHFDESLRYDMKKSDGWELLYSTFSDSLNWGTRSLVLYNKFRGVLRCYFHNPNPVKDEIKAAKFLVNEIEYFGQSSPAFNFAGQHIVDMDANSRGSAVIEPAFLEEQGWYISEFEVAYDVKSRDARWPYQGYSTNSFFTRMADMSYNNEPVLNRHIHLQKAGTLFSPSGVRASPVTGNLQCFTKSTDDLDRLQGIFPPGVINGIKNSLVDAMPANVFNGTLSLERGIANIKMEAPGVLNFIMGGVLLTSPGLAVPGADNSQVTGMGPAYNESLGIFYLDDKPVVKHEQISGNLPEQYTLDVTSVKYIINPFVMKYADVVNFTQEIVAISTGEEKSLTEAKIYRGNILKSSVPLNIIGVRVSFELVPKNGSARVKFIKTFKPEIQGT